MARPCTVIKTNAGRIGDLGNGMSPFCSAMGMEEQDNLLRFRRRPPRPGDGF